MEPPASTPELDLAARIDRCRREIAAIEAEIRAGNPDLQGLCLALADWSAELRLVTEEGPRPKWRYTSDSGTGP